MGPGVYFIDNQQVVEDLICEFEFWVIELEPEYFMRRLRLQHKHWVLSRVGVVKEPKEKWRYLMASRMRPWRRRCRRPSS